MTSMRIGHRTHFFWSELTAGLRRSHDFARLKACCRTSSHRGWINGKTADGLLHLIRRRDLARKTEILAEFEAWQARLNSTAAGKPRGRRGAFGPNFCFSS